MATMVWAQSISLPTGVNATYWRAVNVNIVPGTGVARVFCEGYLDQAHYEGGSDVLLTKEYIIDVSAMGGTLFPAVLTLVKAAQLASV